MTSHIAQARTSVVHGLAFAVFAALASGCQKDPFVPGAAADVLGVSMGSIRNAIAVRLDSGQVPSWVPADEWKRVRRIYAVYNNAPLWLEPDGVKERANALLKALEDGPSHGLSTAAYPADSVRRVVAGDSVSQSATPETLAEADVLLTAAYIGYATDMLLGQVDPKNLGQAWHIAKSRTLVDSALVRTLQSPSMDVGLAAMAPHEEGYTQLREQHAHYRDIVAAGGWQPVSRSSPRSAIAARLVAEGFEADSANLAAALRVYQERHGLEEHGKLDASTLRALNVSAEDRLQSITINLERYRWLPRSLGERYVYVNVPAFRLEAYNGGQKELELKVVVGAEYDGRSTPVFADSMEYVVFRPYWNVTPSIAEKEFFPVYGNALPAGYEFWSEGGEKRIRQVPGDKNSLGLVKFLFPNSFNIYLHDTPAKSLFERASRAASHGCIRVEDPARLAEWVLGWDGGRVESAMHGADNRTITLPRKIPVYIVYFTAYMRDGHLHFGDDVYERDDSLRDGLDTVPPPNRASDG
jgi:L,D-transpeptidase YcbB